jgi:hypothetical protein
MKPIESDAHHRGQPEATRTAHRPAAAHRMPSRRAWGGVVLVALVTVGFVACGCGAREDDAPMTTSATDQAAVLVPASGASPVARMAGVAAAEPTSEALAAASADSLPPDVAASVADTLVFAGGSVEITAEGSPDVVGVALADGVGRKQAFAYDAHADLWRVFYRVPVRPATGRLALSVTARNAAHRWRRVWVFLSVQPGSAPSRPDSAARP